MTRHKCNRDNCPPNNITGPKIKCAKCKNLCFLQCFGFESGEKVDGQDTVKIKGPNESICTMFVSCMAFQCCSNVMTDTDQKKALKLPTVARSTSKNRSTSSLSNDNEQLLVNELTHIKQMLTSIQNATDENTAEIAEIKMLSTKTEENVKKATEMNQLKTPQNGAAMSYVDAYKRNATAAAMETPSSKRKRTDTLKSERRQANRPPAKVGTKVGAIGLTVVPPQPAKPKFEKALFVSGLAPSTTNDELADFIAGNTPVVDREKFTVHKLLKKGDDGADLKYVSFKVCVSVDDLVILDNAELWPAGIRVREFNAGPPKNTFGRHLPPPSANGAPVLPNPKETEMMTEP